MPNSQDIASSLVLIPEIFGHMSDNITENPRSCRRQNTWIKVSNYETETLDSVSLIISINQKGKVWLFDWWILLRALAQSTKIEVWVYTTYRRLNKKMKSASLKNDNDFILTTIYHAFHFRTKHLLSTWCPSKFEASQQYSDYKFLASLDSSPQSQ